MTAGTGGSALLRYERAVAASRELTDAQRAAAQAGEGRVDAEVELDTRRSVLAELSRLGPATWGLRLRGQLADRQARAAEAVRSAEVTAAAASLAHRSAVERLLHVQETADDLPSAREAVAASLTGPDAEQASALLGEAQQLAESLFTAQSARLLASRLDSDLATAGTWSTYDTYLGGGMVSGAMKLESVDSAGDLAQALPSLLTGLRAELQDLGAPTAYFGVEVHDGTTSWDVWADSIVADWGMDQKIDAAHLRTQRLVVGLDELMARLGERHTAVIRRLDAVIEGSGTK